MKRIFQTLCIAFAMALLPACQAVNYVPIASIIFTNAPADGDTVTVNGAVRTFKTSVSSPSTQIAIGANTNLTAASYKAQIDANLYTGISAHQSGGSVFLVGSVNTAMTASLSGSWGVISVSNQPLTNYTAILPFSSYPTTNRQTMGNLLIDAISLYPTNRVSATAAAFLNYFSLSQSNTVAGGNLFSGANIFSGPSLFTNASQVFTLGKIDDTLLTNIPAGYFTNLYARTMGITNLSPTISLWDTNGSVGADEHLYQIIAAGGGFQIVFNSDAVDTPTPVMIIARSGVTPSSVFFPVGIEATYFKNGNVTNTVITNSVAGFTALYATSGTLNGLQVTNAIGLAGALTKLTGGFWDSGGATNLTTTNTTFTATNNFTGDVAFVETVNAGLANGANVAIDFGTTATVILNPGPSTAFSIAGIVGGRSGKTLTILNKTGQAMTISNDTLDPTPANRILTLTGADVTTTGDGAVTLRYFASISRWVIQSIQL